MQDFHNQRLKITVVCGQSGGSHITSHSITGTFQSLKVLQELFKAYCSPPKKIICFRFKNLSTGGSTTAGVHLVSYSCYLFPISDLQLASFSCCCSMPACWLKELSTIRCLHLSSCLIQRSRKQSYCARFKSIFCKSRFI